MMDFSNDTASYNPNSRSLHNPPYLLIGSQHYTK
jgi:hypothetical protein